MAKDRHKKSAASEGGAPPPAAKGGGGGLLPPWAMVVIVLMLLYGGYALATRETQRREGAIAALNNASVQVAGIEDGLDVDFGHAAIPNSDDQRAFLEALGYCHSDPVLAQTIFRRLLDDGGPDGTILACQMAFYLAQEGRLERADLDHVVGLLDPERSIRERRVAQATLGALLLLPDTGDPLAFEQLPPAPKGVQADRWAAQTKQTEIYKKKYRTVKWSSPEACQAWWKEFGASGAAWDPGLKRFLVRAAARQP